MIIYKRILGFLISFLFAIFIEIAYYSHGFFFFGLVLSIILLIFYFTRIKNRFVEKKEIISYFLVSFVYLLSFWSFFIVADNFFIRNLIVVFSIYFFITLFDSIFKKIYDNTPINKDIIRGMDLIIFLFFSFFTFFVFTFLRANLILTFVFIFFVALVCMNIKLYWNNVNSRLHRLDIFIISLIVSEVYLVMAFLPFNLYFLTLVPWLCYYVISDFVLTEIRGEFLMRKKSRILIIAGIILLLTFLTILKY